MEERVATPTSPGPSPATPSDAGSHEEPSPAAGANDASPDEPPKMIPWAPLAIPVVAAIFAGLVYSVGWLVLQR